MRQTRILDALKVSLLKQQQHHSTHLSANPSHLHISYRGTAQKHNTLHTSTNPIIKPSAPPHHHNPSHPFTSTSRLTKKSNNKPPKPSDPASDPATSPPSTPSTSTDNPFDLSTLSAAITAAHAKLRDDLSKLRTGGKFNPDVVDALRVQLGGKGEKDGHNHTATVRLGDLAQVVPRGRVLEVMVGEREHVKLVSSAIASSNLSLTPQQDARNPLQLNVAIPPPTAESKQLAVQAVAKAGEVATAAVRNARAGQHKRLRAMLLSKEARPDDVKKAEKDMEKVVEGGNAEVKKIVDSARKVLEGG